MQVYAIDEVSPQARLEHWRALVDEHCVPVEVEPVVDLGYGRIDSDLIGVLDVSDVRASAQIVRRKTIHISRGNPDQYQLMLPMGSGFVLEQDGRQTVVRESEFAIHDCTRPYTLAFEQDFRVLVFMFERKLLAIPPASVSAAMTQAVTSKDGMGAIAAQLLVSVAGQLHDPNLPRTGRLAENVLDLVEMTLLDRVGADSDTPAFYRTLFLRIHAYIDTHLGDPRLVPASIAAAHNISTRQLHRLFEANGATVAAFIRDRRLERCRRDFSNPLLADRTISSLAEHWGLTDPAYFSRAFRAAYGVGPREYRTTACMRQAS